MSKIKRLHLSAPLLGLLTTTAAFTVTAGLLWFDGYWGLALCAPLLAVAFYLGNNAQPVLVLTPTLPPEPLEMVELVGGAFWMDSDEADDLAENYEKPRHRVIVSAFAMAKFPITRKLYRDIMEKAPSEWPDDQQDDSLPANHVSWFDAIAFCNALSEQQGLQPCYEKQGKTVTCDWAADGYRLPTEAQWEYAVRGGTETRWFFGDKADDLDRYAWYGDNANGQVHPVGEKEPNPFQLHDLIGNVWEWCWDRYGGYSTEQLDNPTGAVEGDGRVLRGGSFFNPARVLRSAYWFVDEPEYRVNNVGLRCVRVPRRQS